MTPHYRIDILPLTATQVPEVVNTGSPVIKEVATSWGYFHASLASEQQRVEWVY